MKRLFASVMFLAFIAPLAAQDTEDYFAGNVEYAVPEYSAIWSHAVEYYHAPEGDIWLRIYPPIGGVTYRDRVHTYIYVQFGQPLPGGNRSCTGQIQVSIGNSGWQFAGRLTPGHANVLAQNAQCCLQGNQDIYAEGYVSTYYEDLWLNGTLGKRFVVHFEPK